MVIEGKEGGVGEDASCRIEGAATPGFPGEDGLGELLCPAAQCEDDGRGRIIVRLDPYLHVSEEEGRWCGGFRVAGLRVAPQAPDLPWLGFLCGRSASRATTPRKAPPAGDG